MADTLNPSERLLDIAGLSVELRRAGQGAPLLVLHGELGMPGWLDCHQALAAQFDVIVPSLPGYGRTTRPDWIMSQRDLAAWVTWFARDLGLTQPVHLLGSSLGGWVAAEIATVAPGFIDKLVLVGPMGLKPDHGEIFDYFLESGLTGLRRNFHRPEQSTEFMRHYGRELSPEDLDQIEQHREMTCRVAWKPYMHSLTLRHLLPAVANPTLILWGAEDSVVPLDSGAMYQRAIPNARLAVIPDCGHLPDLEQPAATAKVIAEFLAE